mgnify:CR=1 FL=1
MGIILFFLVTGLLNFAAGFALAMMLDLGPRSWRDVTAWIAARRPAAEDGP